MKYCVIVGRSPGDLAKQVNDTVAKATGYELQGGVAIDGPFYVQAIMIIEEKPDAPEAGQRKDEGQGKDIPTPEPLSGVVGKAPDVIRRKGHKV